MDISFIVKNKKKIIVGIIILLILLIGQSLVNSTYSLFYHEDTAANADSYSTGILSIIASSKGENISLGNTLPMSDSEGEATTPYTFTIKNIGNLDYKFDVKLLSTAGSDITIDSRYIKVKVDDGSPATLSSLSNSIIKSDITLASGESIDISIRVWLSIDTPNTQIGKVFNSKIVTDGQAVYTSSNNKPPAATDTLNKLNKLNDTIVLASDTPNFTTVSGNNGIDKNGNGGLGDGTKGIYAAEDDLGISYYFRGAVDNNYVKFANFYWRIIRINGDGTIRMIYAGPYAESFVGVSETVYNDISGDNTYVGYMTGTEGATNYASTHSNTTDSTIKGVIDTWYETNIVDKGYSSYVADAIYCNDRSVANNVNTGLGYGTNATVYAGYKRSSLSVPEPSLICPNDNDKFTMNSTLGNGKLTYPVALITADEIMYAGGFAYENELNSIANEDFYLLSYVDYWTMTPYMFVDSIAFVAYWDGMLRLISYIDVDNPSTTNIHATFHPVLSLNSNAITGGNGTMDNPFIVG